MERIGLDYAFTINVDIARPLDGGPGRNGRRRVIQILGGTVTGPRLSGRVLPGGADYELERSDGCSVVTAHYALVADDGTPIYVRNQGLFVAPQAVLARVNAGEVVAPEDYYFRAAPVFDAPQGPHVWLADRLFVSECRFRQTEVEVRVYEVV